MPFANLVQVVLPMDSGLPEDAVVNTWHIITTDEKDNTAIALAVGAIEDVYQALNPYLSRMLANNPTAKVYNRNDVTPRIPYNEYSLTLDTPTSGVPLPSEVALCLSFKAVPVSGTVPARRRGRTYMGPFQTNVCGTSGVELGRPTASFQDVLRDAGAALLVASNAASSWSWAVFSEIQRGLLEEDYYGEPVVAGWVDDAFDTQRRRGVAPSTRLLFPTP